MHADTQTITRKQSAMLHAAAGAGGLSDAEYRDILRRAAGVASSKHLDQAGLERVISFLKAAGCPVVSRPGQHTRTRRPGRASPEQLDWIARLREDYFGPENPDAFHRWLAKYFKVDHLNFLTPGQAAKVIEALKAMNARKRGDAT